MTPQTIGIQGIAGSFHHQVALDYFGKEVLITPYGSFSALTQALVSGAVQTAIMAIENSIAGSILPNYALIDHNDLVVTGEHYLTIHHQLLALPGQQISDLEEVRSHPMALLQCTKFLQQHPHIRLVEADDTAAVAERIAQHQWKGIAAIASQTAGDLYGLETLAASIQTIPNNITRFVLVEKQAPPLTDRINKAALLFTLDHQRGSLATILNVMSDCQLNLTKIQSLPVIETPGKYAFFVDVTFDALENYTKAKSILNIMAQHFKVLGEYTKKK
ncbi:MAG: prephenate dehydratase [Flavobacteriaceae bacterium]